MGKRPSRRSFSSASSSDTSSSSTSGIVRSRSKKNSGRLSRNHRNSRVHSSEDGYSGSRKNSSYSENKIARQKRKKSQDTSEHFSFYHEEVSRLTEDLLMKSSSLAAELKDLYKRLDNGESVALDDLPDKHLRKKLRHTFKAWRLEEVVSNEDPAIKYFKRPKKMPRGFKLEKTFKYILKDIQQKLESKRCETVGGSAYEKGSDKVQKTQRIRIEEGPISSPVEDRDKSAVSDKTSKDRAREGQDEEGTKPRRYIGPAAPNSFEISQFEASFGGKASSSDEEDAADADEHTPERAGGDEDEDTAVPQRKRSEWMTEVPIQLKGLFVSRKGKKGEPKKEDPVVKRFKEAESQRMKDFMLDYNSKHRNKSLLEMHREGAFERDRDKQLEYIRSHQTSDPYGKKTKGSGRGLKGDATVGSEPWNRFDRETDLEVRRQVSSHDFHRLLDQSKKLNERFGESHFQGSFL